MPEVEAQSVLAMLYRRVSTDEQQKDGLSLAAQQMQTRVYAASHHWTIAAEFVDVLSGARDDRPGYLELLAEAHRHRHGGRAVIVVVSRLDRFGRSVLERARSAEELRKLRIPIHSVNDGGLLPDLVGDLLAAVAEEEVRRVRQRSAEIHQFVLNAGWHYPTRPAWGYRRRLATPWERSEGAPHTVLEVDTRRARYVREAFNRAADGESGHQ
jgi:DNA invertase Pin-like site-specific DNA recombinase